MNQPTEPASHADRYSRIIEKLFFEQYSEGTQAIPFKRDDLVRVAKEFGIEVPKNLGDILYSFRYRKALPQSIREKAPKGMEWIIRGGGKAEYRFELVQRATIRPNLALAEIKVPDATPGIIGVYALDDEQALLAKLRYNRLIDTFTSVTCYSLQSHLRTQVKGVGQVETDEVYIGVDKRGVHYVFPV